MASTQTKQKVVGIVPTAKLFKDDNPYGDTYTFVNNYVKRIEENGAIPIGILSNDGYVNKSSLELCDSFLIVGGLQIHPYHFEVVEYAIKNRKPLLGICLGLQVIHSYFIVLDEAEKRNYTGKLLDLYIQMKKEKYMFVLPVEHHWDVHMLRDNIDDTKHKINVIKGTRMHDLLKKDEVWGSSMHRYRVNNVSKKLTISGTSDDGTIEMLEYDNFVFAVQFHPEVENKFDVLFKIIC